MKPNETKEMAYPRKYVENIIIGLEDPLNEHLVKLVGFDFPTEARAHFWREVRSWLAKIQRLRMKPDSRTGSFKFYYDLLFDYPFGGWRFRICGQSWTWSVRSMTCARPNRPRSWPNG